MQRTDAVKASVPHQGGTCFEQNLSICSCLPDALEQFGAQRSGYLSPSWLSGDFRALEDAVRQAEFAEHGLHLPPEPDSVSRSEVNAACQSGDAVPAYPMVTVPKRNFLSWRSVTFPVGVSNKILAHSRSRPSRSAHDEAKFKEFHGDVPPQDWNDCDVEIKKRTEKQEILSMRLWPVGRVIDNGPVKW